MPLIQKKMSLEGREALEYIITTNHPLGEIGEERKRAQGK